MAAHGWDVVWLHGGEGEFHRPCRALERCSPQGGGAWLVGVVIVAFLIGSSAGMVTLKPGEGENGQSRLADQTLATQFPR